VRRAQAIMNRKGMRSIRLPLGELAVAYPLKSNIEEIRWAMRVLRMDLPLVLNDEGLDLIQAPGENLRLPTPAEQKKSTSRPLLM